MRALREKGYQATTLDDIAEHVGMRKTALYHYFRDKEAILYGCHRETLANLARIMRKGRKLRGATERLSYLIREHVMVMAGSLGGSPLTLEVSVFTGDHRAVLVAARDRYEREVRDIIEQGMREGEFRPGDAKTAAFVILGALNWIANWFRPDGELRPAELADRFVVQLLLGLVDGTAHRRMPPVRVRAVRERPAAETSP
jgi:AcrR family transcriptional regulator